MATVSYLKGLNFQDGNSILMAIFGNDVAFFSGGNWVGQAQNLVPGAYEVTMGKKYAFMSGLGALPRVISSTGVFSKTINLENAPQAKSVYYMSDRVYFGNVVINGDSYQRRIFYTDIIEKDDGVVWGLEYGSDLVQTAGSETVTSVSAYFKRSNIKVGDPFLILNGGNAGTYYVDEVTSDSAIVLDRALSLSATGSKFLVGGNWFDVDNALETMGEHYGILLGFEKDKVWRYNQSIGRKPIIGAKGTTSVKSVVSNHRGYTFWYHPSDGILQYNGSTATTISNKIAPILEGMTEANYDDVVGWPGVGKYKDHVYFYIGNSSFKVNGESFSLTNVVIDYNISRSRFKVYEYNTQITCATTFIETNKDVVYLGTPDSVVLKFNDGNSDYNTTANDGSTLPIRTYLVTHPIFPSGVEIENHFDKQYAWADSGTGIKSKYKLYGTPNKNDSDWNELMEINDQYEENKIPPQKAQARGIAFMVEEISTNESFEFLGFSFIYSVVGEVFSDELS